MSKKDAGELLEDQQEQPQYEQDAYLPDCWVIVRLSGSDIGETYYRILAGWYGGFAGSDAWRLSSGITTVKEYEGHYKIKNESGSIYICKKQYERLSSLTASVLAGYGYKKPEELLVERVGIKDVPQGVYLEWFSNASREISK